MTFNDSLYTGADRLEKNSRLPAESQYGQRLRLRQLDCPPLRPSGEPGSTRLIGSSQPTSSGKTVFFTCMFSRSTYKENPGLLQANNK